MLSLPLILIASEQGEFMNRFKQSLAVATLALSVWGSAHADQVWAWSYSGSGVMASGTLTTAGPATSFEDVIAISGMRNGVAITGLVPLDTDPDYLYDNQFRFTSPSFTDGGLVIALAGGAANVNLYYFDGTYTDLQRSGVDIVQTDVIFSVSAVPEPASGLALLAGLGLLGAHLRRVRASA